MTAVRAPLVFRAAIAGAAAAVALVVPVSPAYAAPPTAGVGIAPGDERDYFHVTLAAGQHTERKAVVRNSSPDPVDILIYPVDAAITPQGGFALDEQNVTPRTVGSWTHLPVSRMHLNGYESTSVTVPISVPDGTPPGDYAGGVVVQRAANGIANTVQNGVSVQLNIIERVGARIYLKVPGQQQAALEAGPLIWYRDGTSVVFSATITNKGNIRLHPTAKVKVTGFGLPETAIAMSQVEELLPGTSVTVTGSLKDAPLLAVGQATLIAEDGVGHQVTRTASINLVSDRVGFAGGSVALLLFGTVTWFLVARRRPGYARRRYQPRRLRKPVRA
jgi:hypothetical protein